MKLSQNSHRTVSRYPHFHDILSRCGLELLWWLPYRRGHVCVDVLLAENAFILVILETAKVQVSLGGTVRDRGDDPCNKIPCKFSIRRVDSAAGTLKETAAALDLVGFGHGNFAKTPCKGKHCHLCPLGRDIVLVRPAAIPNGFPRM